MFLQQIKGADDSFGWAEFAFCVSCISGDAVFYIRVAEFGSGEGGKAFLIGGSAAEFGADGTVGCGIVRVQEGSDAAVVCGGCIILVTVQPSHICDDGACCVVGIYFSFQDIFKMILRFEGADLRDVAGEQVAVEGEDRVVLGTDVRDSFIGGCAEDSCLADLYIGKADGLGEKRGRSDAVLAGDEDGGMTEEE